jgi:hypothetical protein
MLIWDHVHLALCLSYTPNRPGLSTALYFKHTRRRKRSKWHHIYSGARFLKAFITIRRTKHKHIYDTRCKQLRWHETCPLFLKCVRKISPTTSAFSVAFLLCPIWRSITLARSAHSPKVPAPTSVSFHHGSKVARPYTSLHSILTSHTLFTCLLLRHHKRFNAWVVYLKRSVQMVSIFRAKRK